MNKRLKFWLILISTGSFALTLLCLFAKRPVTPTSDWIVTATLADGTPAPCSIKKMWWRKGVLFVEILDPPTSFHHWFALDMENKSAATTSGPEDFPYSHWNYDRTLGTSLLDPMKASSIWTIKWDDDDVTFQDEALKLAVKPASR